MKYRTAPEVRDVIDAVMWDHHPLISEEGIRIEPVMLDKTPKKAGKDIMGRVTKKMGLDAFLGAEERPESFSKTAEAFFVMEVAETWWNSLDATQRRALVDHLLCFPGATSVTGPKVDSAVKRRYSGEIATVKTASGNFLTGTPNHPILTRRGWVPLGRLNKRDHVVSSDGPERVAAGMDPHEHQVVSSIEDVARTAPRSVSVRPGLVPEAAHDLYRNVVNGQVDVVAPARRLVRRFVAPVTEHLRHVLLDSAHVRGPLLTGAGDLDPRLFALRTPTARGAGLLQRVRDGLLAEDLKPVSLGGAGVPDRNPGGNQLFFDDSGAGADLLLERMKRSAGRISFDKVLNVDLRPWSGHVYNLQTTQGWYFANNIVTHNCHIQYDEDGDNWRVIPPQHGEYPEIVERYGFWRPDTSLARLAVKLEHQLSLLTDEQREDLLKEPEPDQGGADGGAEGGAENAGDDLQTQPILAGVGAES